MAAVYSWSCALHLYGIAEYVPLFLYCGVSILLTLPLNVLCRATRQFFASTILRVLLPVQEVSWADFLLADMFTSLSKSTHDFTRAMCTMATASLSKSTRNLTHAMCTMATASLSKSTRDLTHAMCTMATGPVMRTLTHGSHEPAPICAPLSPLVLGALVLPYFIRLVQCIIVYRTTGNGAQLFNAAKYCSAFPALILSSMEHEAHTHNLAFAFTNLWLLSSALNSIYSFYWDVEMDWDMPWLYQRRPQHQLRYIGDLEAHNTVALVFGLLEVFRRFQWAYIRVETELRKIQQRGATADNTHVFIGSAVADGMHHLPPHTRQDMLT
eukprot:gene24690-10321_t